jgi:hypothetical protein
MIGGGVVRGGERPQLKKIEVLDDKNNSREHKGTRKCIQGGITNFCRKKENEKKEERGKKKNSVRIPRKNNEREGRKIEGWKGEEEEREKTKQGNFLIQANGTSGWRGGGKERRKEGAPAESDHRP